MISAVERTDVEELIEVLGDKSPVGVCIIQEGKFCYLNPAFSMVTGYSADELEGKDSLMLVAPADREVVSENTIKMLKGELSSPYQFRVTCKDGSIKWVMQTLCSIQYRGRPATLGNYMDITERKQAEEALCESEERYRELANSITDVFFAMDDHLRYTYWNKASEILTGIRAEDALGKSLPEIFPDMPGIRRAEKMYRDVLRTQQSQTFVTDYTDRDGRHCIFELSAYPSRDGISVFVRDITERRQAEEALRESEEKYRLLSENASDIIWTADMNLKYTYVSPSVERLLGYTPEELTSLTVDRTLTPPSLELAMRVFQGELAIEQLEQKDSGRTRTMESELVCKDGSTVWVEVKMAFLRDEAGHPTGILGIARDITERKRVEEALKLQKAYFQQLFDRSPDAIVMLDTDDRVVQANGGFATLFGYAREEITGRPINELVIPEDCANEASALSRRVLHGGVVREETARRRRDGSLIDVSIVGYPVHCDRRLVGMYGIYSDITKRKKLEEAIKQAAEEWRRTFDSISDAISIHDKDYRIRRANKAFADLFHMSPRQIIGRHCYEVMHCTQEPVPGCPHQETLQTGKPAGAELFESNLGIYLEVTTSPIFDEKGEIAGIVHIARDISERKQQAVQLMMADRLASIGELASGTAHELNNPLTSVIGFSQLLMERDVPDDMREDLKLIYSEAQRATEVIKNLLTFARKHAPVKQLNRIDNIMEDVLRLRTYEHKVNNIEVKRQFAPDLPQIVVDYFQMQQVFLNIIINAEYFMTEAHNGGTLTIAAKRRNNTMVISVADDGLGISQQDLSQLFNPFFTTKKAGKGTGLGLSICHGIVTEHGGQIFARSKPGKGATFFVELPINGV